MMKAAKKLDRNSMESRLNKGYLPLIKSKVGFPLRSLKNRKINIMEKLSKAVDEYMTKTIGLKEFCDRCLETKRWGGNVVLMVVDAAFDSIGLNYFNSIVPKVIEFEEVFVKSCEIRSLQDLAGLPHKRVKEIWANERSWKVANEVASYLCEIGRRENLDNRQAFRK